MNIHSGRIAKPYRMLVYGVEGVGKSTFASEAPKPIFIPTEDGTDEIDAPKFDRCATEQEFNNCMTYLCRENHEFQTVVVDSIDWLEKLWVDSILENGKKSVSNYPYGEFYILLESKARTLIKGLDYLRNHKKMNVVLIGHSKLEKVVDPSGLGYDQFSPRLEKKTNAVFKEWTDLIGFANYDVQKREITEGFGKRVVAEAGKTFYQAEEGSNSMECKNRVLICTGSPTIVAKSRYSSNDKIHFEEKIPLDGKFFFTQLHNIIWS